MDDIFTRFFADLAGRYDGPLNFRLVLQPLMAIVFAIRDGERDGREGRVPYFWALFTEPTRRREHLRNGWKSVGRVFVLALLMDAIYQFITVRWFYPGEALVTAFFLAIVPYVTLRGVANRLTGGTR